MADGIERHWFLYALKTLSPHTPRPRVVAVSLYMGGTARMNFGPSMAFPPSPALLQQLNLPSPQPIICLQPPKVCALQGFCRRHHTYMMCVCERESVCVRERECVCVCV